tara:strand:- start:2186 stop:2635 length:450 start_codon:yes stop_codon:yes gene_type:complete
MLNGKRYVMVLSDFPHAGECDDPNIRYKKIKIKKGLKGQHHLDTLVHEALHACLWMASEEWVSETASDISRILWRLGYRRVEEESCSLTFEPVREKGQEPDKVVEVESEEERTPSRSLLPMDRRKNERRVLCHRKIFRSKKGKNEGFQS